MPIYWEKLGIDLCKGEARGNATTFVWSTRNIIGWSDAGADRSIEAPISIKFVRSSDKNAS